MIPLQSRFNLWHNYQCNASVGASPFCCKMLSTRVKPWVDTIHQVIHQINAILTVSETPVLDKRLKARSISTGKKEMSFQTAPDRHPRWAREEWWRGVDEGLRYLAMNFDFLSAKCELPLYQAAVRESAWRMDFGVLELDALCAPTTTTMGVWKEL